MPRRFQLLLACAASASGCSADNKVTPVAPAELAPASAAATTTTAPPPRPPATESATAPTAAARVETYTAAGCRRTFGFDGMPPLHMGEAGDIVEGVVCEIDDAATTVPDCDVTAAVYRQVSRPVRAYGVIVRRHSAEVSECQGAYDANGRGFSDLPGVD